MKSFLLILTLTITAVVHAQTTAPCTAAEARQFDFWLGEWDAVYSDTVHASNHITKELGSCVIHEHFTDPSQKFNGESWSVYDPLRKKWQQTWVDDQGGYIVLTGVFENGIMTLLTEPGKAKDGLLTQYKMTYSDITPASFSWNWEQTKDEGKTWKSQWKISYRRK